MQRRGGERGHARCLHTRSFQMLFTAQRAAGLCFRPNEYARKWNTHKLRARRPRPRPRQRPAHLRRPAPGAALLLVEREVQVFITFRYLMLTFTAPPERRRPRPRSWRRVERSSIGNVTDEFRLPDPRFERASIACRTRVKY